MLEVNTLWYDRRIFKQYERVYHNRVLLATL